MPVSRWHKQTGDQFPRIGAFLYTENGYTCLMLRIPYALGKRNFHDWNKSVWVFDWCVTVAQFAIFRHKFSWAGHERPKLVSLFRFRAPAFRSV